MKRLANTLLVLAFCMTASFSAQAEPEPESVIYLQAQHSGKCVHQQGASLLEGDAVTQWSCVDQPNVRLEKIPMGGGYFLLRFQHSGLCLSIENEASSNGTPIIQQACNYEGPIGQTWMELPGVDEYVYIQSTTGLCLHQHGNSLNDGDPITGWECVDQPNVRWKVAPYDLQDELPIDSPNTDPTSVNNHLESFFTNATLDEDDRTALQLSADEFTQLTSSELHSTLNSTHICEVNYDNQPRISRVLPASDGYLVPAELFMIKGVCLGSNPGTVEIRFGGSPVSVYRPLVVDWESNKILAQVPKDISGFPPTKVQVVIITADQRKAAPHTIDFWPRWELVSVGRYARNSTCYSDPTYPHVRSYCEGVRDTVPKLTTPFDLPQECRGAFCFLDFFVNFDGLISIISKHYTEEDIAVQPTRGIDRWTFDLPHYVRIAGWKGARYRTFDPTQTGIRIEADQSTRELVVYWHMSEMGETGYLVYQIDDTFAWIPLGTLRQ